ncbi:hypothetical protein [Shimia sp.]
MFITLAGALALIGCGSSTTTVSTKSAEVAPQEVFRIKNTLAEQTGDPGAAKFQNVYVADLSNGDRVYCGQMSFVDQQGGLTGFTPFYLRQRGEVVKAINWLEHSAEFSSQKCAEARSGALRINDV